MTFELKPGVVLNDTYRLLEIIGRGGMGEVWKAQHERLPKVVAVKVLLDASLTDDTSFARFRREAEIASRLGHPNIVEVLDFNTLTGGIPYMVLELLEGESLRERLKRGPLPLDQARRILKQVGTALTAAHEQGVVHRDLKPENIFLCPEPGDDGPTERAKVLDFGISKIQGGETALTHESEVLGTPVYMAPEQAAGRLGKVDGRTDQFALAAIAYEMLSGQMAFQGHTLIEIIGKILEGNPKPLTDLAPEAPEPAVAAINRALAKTPEDRFPSISAFVDSFITDRVLPVMTRPGLGALAPVPEGLGTGPTQAMDSERVVSEALRAAETSREQEALRAAEASREQDALAETAISHDHLTGLPAGSETPPPQAPSPAPAPRPRRASWLALGIGLGVGVAVTVAALIVLRAPRTERAPSTAQATRTTDAAVSMAASPSRPPVDAGPARRRVAAPPPHDGGTPPAAMGRLRPRPMVPARPRSRPPGPRRRRPPRPGMTSVPAEVKQALDQADQALRSGAWSQALHLARRSLLVKRTSRAFLIMVKAHCGQRDLRLAKARLQLLGGTSRRQAIRWCKGKGMDLEGS